MYSAPGCSSVGSDRLQIVSKLPTGCFDPKPWYLSVVGSAVVPSTLLDWSRLLAQIVSAEPYIVKRQWQSNAIFSRLKVKMAALRFCSNYIKRKSFACWHSMLLCYGKFNKNYTKKIIFGTFINKIKFKIYM